MNIRHLFRAFFAVAAFAATSLIQASPITNPASWTTSGNGDVTTVTATAGGVDLYYKKGSYFCAGCGSNYFNYSTTVTATGTGGVDFSYNAFNAWFMADSNLTVLVNNIAIGIYGNGANSTFSHAFTAGDNLRFTGYMTNFDSQPEIWGTIALTNFSGALIGEVPEPASIALFGLGLFGVAAARRRLAARR